MKLSLRNLLGRCVHRSAARSPAPPADVARLSVERLEDRAVPTVNLIPYHFVLPNAGTLQVTSQNFLTDSFKGTFTDSHSGIKVAISGQLTPVFGNWDRMTFHGSGHAWLESETVKFNGWLNEGQALDEIIPPKVEGYLTENHVLFISPFPGQDPHWSTASWEMAHGQF